MVHHLFPHLYTLVSDPDNEVRRAASENIVKLALRIDREDVVTLALSIPLRLVKEGQARAAAASAAAVLSNNPGGDSNTNSGTTSTSTAATAVAGQSNVNASKTNNSINSTTTTGSTNITTTNINPRTTAEELLITASNLLADLFLLLTTNTITTRNYIPISLTDNTNFGRGCEFSCTSGGSTGIATYAR